MHHCHHMHVSVQLVHIPLITIFIIPTFVSCHDILYPVIVSLNVSHWPPPYIYFNSQDVLTFHAEAYTIFEGPPEVRYLSWGREYIPFEITKSPTTRLRMLSAIILPRHGNAFKFLQRPRVNHI